MENFGRKAGAVLAVILLVVAVWYDSASLTEETKIAREILSNPATEVMKLAEDFRIPIDDNQAIIISADALVYQGEKHYLFVPQRGDIPQEASKFGVQSLKMAPRYSNALVISVDLVGEKLDLLPL
ncbi:hypothetical protein ACFL16_01830 [Patescibacteria group bacterium]